MENRTVAKTAFSITELAKDVNIGRTRIYEEIREGRLRARKCGKRTIVTREDRDAWLAGLPPWPAVCCCRCWTPGAPPTLACPQP